MKKITLLVLFFTSLAFAQPDIANPLPQTMCDTGNDGSELFDLSASNPEILDGLNPSLYEIGYYLTLSDAQNQTGSVPTFYQNVSNPQTLHVRVHEIADPTNVAYTTLDLILNQSPDVFPIPDLVVFETPTDGFATFDMASQIPAITGGQPSVSVTFHINFADAINGTNAIANANNFTNSSNPQTIFVRAQDDATGCYSTMQFNLVVLEDGILNIPDINFRNRVFQATSTNNIAKDYNGNSLDIDANNDSQIQISEAIQVYELNLNNAIINNYQGLEGFSSLRVLNAGWNTATTISLAGNTNLRTLQLVPCDLNGIDISMLTQLESFAISETTITALNVSANTALTNLYVRLCQLPSIDVSMLTQLETLNVDNNNLTALDVSNNGLLKNLYFSNNLLTDIDLSALSNLQELQCRGNNLTDINLSQNFQLVYLDVALNQLTSLNLMANPLLSYLDCSNNSLGTLDVSGNPQLGILYCSLIGISTLDLSANPALYNIDCSNNLLTALDLQNNTSVGYLDCHNNQLTTLDTSMLLQLSSFDCSQNPLTTLDITGNPQMCLFQATEMPNLETIFMKNGDQGCFMEFIINNNPNLYYVCTDDYEVQHFQEYLGTSVTVNSYCSFEPAGDFHTISGTVYFDADNNGCSASDPIAQFVRVDITNGTDSGSTFTDADGNYVFYVGGGTFTVTASCENPSLFNFAPPQGMFIMPAVGSTTATMAFCVSPNGVQPDLEVVVAPLVPARPGFPAKYKVVYRNKGNQIMSQTDGVSLTFDDTRMTYTSASVIPGQINGGTLSWDYDNLMPFETRSFEVNFMVNSPLDAIPVNNGDVLTLTAVISPDTNDFTVEDNTFVLDQVVVGSYDPNDKHCLQGDVVSVSQIGEFLHYIINFENTGTFFAQNIVVKDIINEGQYDLQSLQVLEASHDVYTRIADNKIEFVFEGINLEIGGHGNILLKVKSLGNLSSGDTVANDANIYFDYNHPILTNLAETTFQSLNVDGPQAENSVSVYPNPSSGIVFIESTSPINRIELYDVQGRLLQISTRFEANPSLDLSSREKGLYFLKVVNADGIAVEKVVRE